MEDNDAQLQFKKRARRRLVGAVFFASIVAVILPMVMDHEPRQQVQDVEIRIPGQDEKPFAPRFAAPDAAPEPVAPIAAASVGKPVVAALDPGNEKAPVKAQLEKPIDKPKTEKPSEKPEAKALAKPDKSMEKPLADKGQPKPADKPQNELVRNDEAKRAAAILAGQGEARIPAKGGEFLVLIGAFANEDNVRHLKAKLGEQGVKTFSEPLDTPQGRKIRLRAGPFASRDAAEKALDKMKRIGVSGVVAAKP